MSATQRIRVQLVHVKSLEWLKEGNIEEAHRTALIINLHLTTSSSLGKPLYRRISIPSTVSASILRVGLVTIRLVYFKFRYAHISQSGL
jgi:hypothetical protein